MATPTVEQAVHKIMDLELELTTALKTIDENISPLREDRRRISQLLRSIKPNVTQ